MEYTQKLRQRRQRKRQFWLQFLIFVTCCMLAGIGGYKLYKSNWKLSDIDVPIPSVSFDTDSDSRSSESNDDSDDTDREAIPLPKLIKQVEPGVVQIMTDRASGSGFLVDSTGVVVTNFHVVEGATSVTALFHDGSEVDVAGVLFVDSAKDIAILKLAEVPSAARPIPLASEFPEKGEAVVTFGSPEGFLFSISEGIISGIRSEAELRALGFKDKGTTIQTTAPISRGNSGGPLVNRQGEVVGANTWMLVDSQNLNFAISSIDIADALDKASSQSVKSFAKVATTNTSSPKRSSQAPPPKRPQIFDITGTREASAHLAALERVAFRFSMSPTDSNHSRNIPIAIEQKSKNLLNMHKFEVVSIPATGDSVLLVTLRFDRRGRLRNGVLNGSLYKLEMDDSGNRRIVEYWQRLEHIGAFTSDEIRTGVLKRIKTRSLVNDRMARFFRMIKYEQNRLRKALSENGAIVTSEIEERASEKLKLAKQFLAKGNRTTAKKWLIAIIREFSETKAADEATQLLEKF